MSLRSFCRLVAGLAAGWMAIPDAAAQPYLGFGATNLSLASQYSAIGTQSGSGFTLFAGFEFVPTWFAELSISATQFDVGQTENIYYPPDSAEYAILRLSLGKRFWPIAEREWSPWIAVGRAVHYVNWNTYAYAVHGAGFSLGGGVDFEPVRSWRLRLQATWYRFDAYDTYDYGPYASRSRELSAAVLYAFR